MTIHVFGDSFSDEPDFDEEPSRWIHLLREKYGTVHNHSKGATGPQYSFREILSVLSSSKVKKVVFIMSDRNRIKFPFIMKDDHIPSAYEVVNNAPLTDEEMYLKKWTYEISMGFKMFETEIKYLPFFIILLLKHFSERFGIKILVIPAFNSIKYNRAYFDPYYLNDNDFKVCNFDLHGVSSLEFKGAEIVDHIESKRLNHLSKPNHEILFNICSNFFSDTTLVEDFHQNLYDKTGKILKRFIYE